MAIGYVFVFVEHEDRNAYEFIWLLLTVGCAGFRPSPVAILSVCLVLSANIIEVQAS